MADIEVVISGIGANFPGSSDLKELSCNLFANKAVTSRTNRWKYDTSLDVQPVCGETQLNHFDHSFFGVFRNLAVRTDPVSKLGYQRSFEAIIDSGYHPDALRGKCVGVYAGSSVNEFEQKVLGYLGDEKIEGYTVMGMARTMASNRLSYYFDFKGPSCSMDSTWAFGHLGLQQAAKAIRGGECEAALVVAANISRYPQTSALLKQLGLISKDGTTRSFDKDASGSVRSDASVAFFLQRGDHARRCYAKVIASDVQFIGDNVGINITLPDPSGMARFLAGLYSQSSTDPSKIAYLVADGSGNPLRDECELNAIDAALVKGSSRASPLTLGSPKGIIGHTDAVSALAAVAMAVVAMETSAAPATINYRAPNSGAEGLVEGRLQVATKNMPLQLTEESVVSVNTLGLPSMMGHTILKPNPRELKSPQDRALKFAETGRPSRPRSVSLGLCRRVRER